MTWFADLSICTYVGLDELGMRAIGWLEPEHAFPKGEVEPIFFSRLCQLLEEPWCPGAWGGVHFCDFCRRTRGGAVSGGPITPVGSTVLIVPGERCVYVTPNTIAHYIEAHGYAPPREFQDAVLRCPAMGSVEYFDALYRAGGDKFRRYRPMNYRPLGRTGWDVSTISFGAWAIGGAWGDVSDEESLAALHRAIDRGVNFIDTADVYGDGRSERLIARVRRERPRDQIIVATKAGRRLDPHVSEGYNRANLTAFVERSLTNLDTDAIDLLQLHCPPTDVYYRPEVFGVLDDLVKQGKLRFYGVSVEKVEEALKAIEYENVQSVQIIFNMLRHRPAERFLPLAKQRQVGVLARVPLASGLLSGKMTPQTHFAADDHRNFNRHGEAFDAGETFSGMGDHMDEAFAAVEELKKLVPPGATLAQFALRWILMFDGVTCAIPGAKRPQQADDNLAAADLPPLTDEQMRSVAGVYDRFVRPYVHHRW